MRLPFFIAFRYLFSRKKQNVINVISAISALAICFISAALIIVLSAFNGLENLVLSLYNSFDPDIKIVSARGKSFPADSTVIQWIRRTDGYRNHSAVVEENALLMYDSRQFVATIKGVEPQFFDMTGIDSLTVEGIASVYADNGITQEPGDSLAYVAPSYCAVIGRGVANALGIDLNNAFSRMQLFFPKRGKKTDMFQPFRNESIQPCGVFAIQQDFDNRFVVVPLEFATYLFDLDERFTAIEVDLDDQADAETFRDRLQASLGQDFVVKTRLEQHALLYKIMKTERLAVFLILSFILLIASFNIIGAMTMLMVEKKKDAMVLWSLGLNEKSIRRIYFFQGMLISAAGAIFGIALGLAICGAQLSRGFVKINSNPDAPAYPIIIQPTDILLTLLVVMVIGMGASWFRAGTFSLSGNVHLGLLK